MLFGLIDTDLADDFLVPALLNIFVNIAQGLFIFWSTSVRGIQLFLGAIFEERYD